MIPAAIKHNNGTTNDLGLYELNLRKKKPPIEKPASKSQRAEYETHWPVSIPRRNTSHETDVGITFVTPAEREDSRVWDQFGYAVS